MKVYYNFLNQFYILGFRLNKVFKHTCVLSVSKLDHKSHLSLIILLPSDLIILLTFCYCEESTIHNRSKQKCFMLSNPGMHSTPTYSNAQLSIFLRQSLYTAERKKHTLFNSSRIGKDTRIIL